MTIPITMIQFIWSPPVLLRLTVVPQECWRRALGRDCWERFLWENVALGKGHGEHETKPWFNKEMR